MANLKDIKNRIGSVKSTQQITKAMKMVSAAKFRKAEEGIQTNRPYSDKVLEVLSSLAMRTETNAHPLLDRREPKNVLLVVFSSDKGLCGSFNGTVIRAVDRFLREKSAVYKISNLYVVGKKAKEYYLAKNVDIVGEEVDLSATAVQTIPRNIAAEIIKLYENEEIDLVYMVYNEFRSALSQQVVFDRLLPIDPLKGDPDTVTTEYICEPSEKFLFDWLLPHYVNVRLTRALLESMASEQGSRMTAMDSATNNATEMISKLVLKYNRARQESITTELMDIVNGVESMR